MKTITIKAEEFLINEIGWQIIGCDGQKYVIKRCQCKKCHNVKGGE